MKISIIIPMLSKESDKLYPMYSRISCVLASYNYELIVVVNGKFDPTSLPGYNTMKHQSKFIVNETDVGAFESRRQGLKEATGNYVWFVDITDQVSKIDIKPFYKDYDMIVHDIAYTTDNGNSYSVMPPTSATEEFEFTNLNPITAKYVGKRYINNYLSNIIFNKDFIVNIYDKTSTIEGFNRFSPLYLNAVALKYVKSLRYVSETISTYFIDKSQLGVDDSNTNQLLFSLNAKKVFSKKRIDELNKHLEKDTVGVAKFINEYIEAMLNLNQIHHHDDE